MITKTHKQIHACCDMLNGTCGNVASQRGLHHSAQRQGALLSTKIKARQGDRSYMKVKR